MKKSILVLGILVVAIVAALTGCDQPTEPVPVKVPVDGVHFINTADTSMKFGLYQWDGTGQYYTDTEINLYSWDETLGVYIVGTGNNIPFNYTDDTLCVFFSKSPEQVWVMLDEMNYPEQTWINQNYITGTDGTTLPSHYFAKSPTNSVNGQYDCWLYDDGSTIALASSPSYTLSLLNHRYLGNGAIQNMSSSDTFVFQ